MFSLRRFTMRRITVFAVVAALSAGAVALLLFRPNRSHPVVNVVKAKLTGPFTVEQRMDQYGAGVAQRIAPAFAAAGVDYPPHELSFVAFKDARVLDLYARNATADAWRFVKRYPVLAASGQPGPKLREGDKQVPEGIYRAELLNPNSRFHLSIRVNYPNAYDRRMALKDGRSNLGGDIMIHGGAVSIGCLAMGDAAAEDLFVLTALATPARTRIVISPTDFRRTLPRTKPAGWRGDLYGKLQSELQQYPVGG
jgi:hypothetical protein